MSRLAIAGAVYRERCLWPDWDQLYGSGGRAACAVARTLIDEVELHTVADPGVTAEFSVTAKVHEFRLIAAPRQASVAFDYVHPMAGPTISPQVHRIVRSPPLKVGAPAVLRFGMLETDAVVTADVCVYDPQSAFGAEPFARNGSRAGRLAVVANRREVLDLSGVGDPIAGARSMVDAGDAEVVVVKGGSRGATVVERSRPDRHVPAFRSERVWTVGSGDVFAAVFAAAWAVQGIDAESAARCASRAVARYAETMALPADGLAELSRGGIPAVLNPGLVYLAGPFFTMAQRWLVDEALRCLGEVGMDVFSPVHDVGPGPAEAVAPADLDAIRRCDAMFAILDGLDSGTLFEVGYARSLGKPVFAFSQQVKDEDLKMVEGSGCHVGADFATLVHHLAWRA